MLQLQTSSKSYVKIPSYILQTNVGPIVLSVNPYRDVGNPLTLTSTKEAASSGCPELSKVVQEAVRMQSESGYPQVYITSVHFPIYH